MLDWKESRTRKMRELASKIAAERRKEKDVSAVLLFGSLAAGDIHYNSDLDIVVVIDGTDIMMRRHQYLKEGISVDLWEHSHSLYARLFENDWKPEEMFRHSLFLNILQDCEILYDKESRYERYWKNVMRWKWPKVCVDFIRDKLGEAIDNYHDGDYSRFEKLVYLRKLFLLDTCRKLLEIGKPVSVRNKDYYLKCERHFSSEDFESVFGRTPNLGQLKLLVETALNLFHREVKNREPWTELKDAENHLTERNAFMTTISLQNGVYYVGSVGLSNRKIRRENKGFLYPESEIELIRKAKEYWSEFYNLYRKVHKVDAWSNRDIDSVYFQLFPKP